MASASSPGIIGNRKASRQLRNENTPETGFHFQGLPTEIRRLVYKELLVQKQSCRLLWCGCRLRAQKSDTKSTDPLAILRTSKLIHAEALPVLYSENTFKLYRIQPPRLCGRCPRSRHDGFVQQNSHGAFFLRKLAFIECYSTDTTLGDVELILKRWSRTTKDLLGIYKNLEQITISLEGLGMVDPLFDGVKLCPTIYFDLIRKQIGNDSTKEPGGSVKNSASPPIIESDNLRQGSKFHAFMKLFCEKVIDSHSNGALKSSPFRIRTIRWTASVMKEQIRTTKVYGINLSYPEYISGPATL